MAQGSQNRGVGTLVIAAGGVAGEGAAGRFGLLAMLRFCAGQVRRTALLGDKGCGADWFRQALTLRSIIPSISLTTNRKTEILFDKKLRKTRHKTENKFGRL